MRHRLLTLLCALTALTLTAQVRLQWGDQGNGTYMNPVLNADFSDPDVIRVGDKYYMVASDFHFMGMQVLESADLVNWRYVSQIYRRLDFPEYDQMARYAGGSWAPAIRHHGGRFYVYFCTPHEGLFRASAEQAEGPWSPLCHVKAVEKWEDPCPLWDDDGQAYLGRSQHGAGPIIVHKMSADGRQLLDDGVTVYTGPVAEGTKWLKRGGWYYLIIPEGGVGQGWQTVLRSRNVYGPYEKRVVLEQGSTAVNGPHQGALVDTPDGEWWFLHFQETRDRGRVVHLQPARWRDDWPLMGVDIDGNGIGEPVPVWQKPSTGASATAATPAPQLPTSDDFSAATLGLQWQWCHNPADEAWSLSGGRLTLQALPATAEWQGQPLPPMLRHARNMLTQKTMGYAGEATTLVTASGEASTGLLCMGRQFCAIGLSPEGLYTECDGQRTIIKAGRLKKAYLRVSIDHGSYQFHYSTDGRHYTPAGDPFAMQNGNWKGVRVGLYCYGDSGQGQFDWFRYDITQ